MTAPRHRVSVCIPTRNHGRYVRQCLESVLAQACDADLQILVGDDCSDDGASDTIAGIAAAHPGVVTHLRHAPRIGPTENMKMLMTRCTGEYIARMDGDDYWLPGKLKAQIAYLDANLDCAAVYTNAMTVDEAGNPIGLFNDAGAACFDLAQLLRHGNFLNNSSVLFRHAGRMAWLTAESTVLDYYVHLWHARSGFLVQLAEPLAAYRVNAHGSMVAGMNDLVRELYWQAIQSVPRELVSDDDYAHGLADFLRRVFFRAVRTRDLALLRKWAARVYPASPYGRVRTSALVTASIVRIGWKMLCGQSARLAGRRPGRILYRR